ncbi:MAG TPA: phenylalanine--tRNA ligase subunit alpha [bacterium]|nr:phenylalanine--tRNA ligase subunit alpha [bacterium]
MPKEMIAKLEAELAEGLAAARTEAALEELRIRFLGRKSGRLNDILRGLKELPPEERREVGAAANRLKAEIENRLEEARLRLNAAAAPEVDLTLPGPPVRVGHRHPLTLVGRELVSIFEKMGFDYREGPEVETDYYNFDALNTPSNHPARDLHDTFYLAPGVLLRTHTSSVQIRVMEREKPPVRIVTLGRCYRRDAQDASHSPTFHQFEGLMVEKGTSFIHLRGVLNLFLEKVFPFPVKTRFTPAFFPFTEPSAEVGISCPVCQARGCPSCGHNGFLEVLGCGMVHPRVLKNVGYDPDKVTGFAFGMGVERIAMIKYGIKDIRLFLENDVRFLHQFS